MDAENIENEKIVTTGDNGVTDNNNILVAEDPSEKKDINSVGTEDKVDNNNIVLPEGGESQEGEVVVVQENQDDNNNVEVILALDDGDISMEIAATTSNIQDTIGGGVWSPSMTTMCCECSRPDSRMASSTSSLPMLEIRSET